MKTYILLGLMQIALIPAFAQRGGHGGQSYGGGHSNGGHSYTGGRTNGGRSYNGGHSYTGGRDQNNGRGHFNGGSQHYSNNNRNDGGRNYATGRYNGNPANSHSYDRSSAGRNFNGYAATPERGRNFGYADHGRYYASADRGYYGAARPYYGNGYNNRYNSYAPRVYGDNFYRNRVFGWGLGLWSPGLVWQQRFYVDLFNCYNAGPYYAPGYYNGYVSDFDVLIQSINDQQYDENKMAVAKEAVQYRNISAAQTAAIMNCFANDQAKIDFAEFAYTHVTDKQNFYTVNNTFTNPDAAQQLGSYLDAQYGN